MIECPFAQAVWSFFFQWWGCCLVIPMSTSLFAQQVIFGYADILNRKEWTVASYAVLHCIWHARNQLIFRCKFPAIGRVLDLVQIKSFHWLEARSKLRHLAFHKWLSDPVSAVIEGD
ncbi:hypothetical protein Ancab_040526 [Ancistrocladus abbreviatus]